MEEQRNDELANTSAPPERPKYDSRGGDERRRKRGDGQPRLSSTGYGDGIERATCIFYRHTLPPEFPVHHRPGLTTRRPIEVDRRPDSVLLCDQNHEGECLWPDGESILGPDNGQPQPSQRNASEQASSEEPENTRND